jgi:hypothetical protein
MAVAVEYAAVATEPLKRQAHIAVNSGPAVNIDTRDETLEDLTYKFVTGRPYNTSFEKERSIRECLEKLYGIFGKECALANIYKKLIALRPDLKQAAVPDDLNGANFYYSIDHGRKHGRISERNLKIITGIAQAIFDYTQAKPANLHELMERVYCPKRFLNTASNHHSSSGPQ